MFLSKKGLRAKIPFYGLIYLELKLKLKTLRIKFFEHTRER